MKRNETKQTIKTVNHTIKYPFGTNKILKTLTVSLNIIKHTYEKYTISSTGSKGYTKQYKTLIQTDDKSFSVHADQECINDKYLDHAIIETLTGCYYNDTVQTYFKAYKNLF